MNELTIEVLIEIFVYLIFLYFRLHNDTCRTKPAAAGLKNRRLAHGQLFYPPATPVDVMVIPRTSDKNNNAQINDRVSRAMAGRSHES